MSCLFCQSEGPFTIEHIIPESLGNDDLLLVDQVCATCNSHFSKIEEFVLQKTALAFWRAFLGIKTKRGRLPTVELSQPKHEKGAFPSVHPNHDNGIGFTSHDDGSTSVDIIDSNIINRIKSGEKSEFRFVMTPKLLFNFGRFLCKIGTELVCLEDQRIARSKNFERARNYARFGGQEYLWPIFHFSEGDPGEFRRVQSDSEGITEEVDCYSYSLIEIGDEYVLLRLGVGTDNWVVCLNDPFPPPEIGIAFPNRRLQCIWYSPEEIENK